MAHPGYDRVIDAVHILILFVGAGCLMDTRTFCCLVIGELCSATLCLKRI